MQNLNNNLHTILNTNLMCSYPCRSNSDIRQHLICSLTISVPRSLSSRDESTTAAGRHRWIPFVVINVSVSTKLPNLVSGAAKYITIYRCAKSNNILKFHDAMRMGCTTWVNDLASLCRNVWSRDYKCRCCRCWVEYTPKVCCRTGRRIPQDEIHDTTEGVIVGVLSYCIDIHCKDQF